LGGGKVSNQVIRYSEAFKIRVIEELEGGRFRSQAEAREFYGLGNVTIRRWLLKYGRNHLVKRVVRVETADERDQLKALKKKVREQEKALAHAMVEKVLSESFLEIACEQLGFSDVESFKKKVDGKL
jgi:transposase